MQPFYILCFIAAFSLFLWQSVSDARQSIVQKTMLLVIIISNGGYSTKRFLSSNRMPAHTLMLPLRRYSSAAAPNWNRFIKEKPPHENYAKHTYNSSIP